MSQYNPPFICESCGKSFYRASALREHKEIKYKCRMYDVERYGKIEQDEMWAECCHIELPNRMAYGNHIQDCLKHHQMHWEHDYNTMIRDLNRKKKKVKRLKEAIQKAEEKHGIKIKVRWKKRYPQTELIMSLPKEYRYATD